MFSEKEISIVRRTWAPVAQDPDGVAKKFYGRLFEVAPEVKPLFSSDMAEQGRKLIQMVGVAVNNMDRLEEVVPAVQALGLRHVGYGAQPDHYPVVGDVLLETLAGSLGEEFTEEARKAWAKTYAALATVMLEA